METIHCEHYVEGDDENYLLDDENILVKKCKRCRNQTNLWTNSTNIVDNNSWLTNMNNNQPNYNNTVLNGGVRTSITLMEDHADTFEDAPLLINDCYHRPINCDDFHCHDILNHFEDVKAWKKLVTASILCFLFMLTELVGGFVAGSLAVMTDAAHLFSDFVGFLISLLSIWLARKSPTKYMTFGYYRAEVLGAFLSVLTIWLLAGVFAVLAINRLWKKEYEIDANTMIFVATLGLIVNLIMGSVLHGYCHNHSHHSHGLVVSETLDSNSNINIRAAAAHVLGDLVQSLGVLIAAIIIKIYPNAKLADPICTLIFSIIVICTTAKIARDSIWLLLEGSPKNSYEFILELKCIPSVKHLHNLHIWTLSPGKNAVAVHLSVDEFCDRDLVLKKATSIMKNKLNMVSCTIQIENYNADIINSCKHCQPLQC